MALQSDNDVSEKLKVLREKFLTRARSDIRELSGYAEQTRSGTLSAEGLIRCYQSLHRLAGSAGTFGLPRLGEQARLIEKQLKSQAEALGETSEAQRQSVEVSDGFADSIDALASLIEESSENLSSAESGNLTSPDQNRFEGSHGMQIRILLVDDDAGGQVASLATELGRYGFICQFVDQRDETALEGIFSGITGASSILCRDSDRKSVV